MPSRSPEGCCAFCGTDRAPRRERAAQSGGGSSGDDPESRTMVDDGPPRRPLLSLAVGPIECRPSERREDIRLLAEPS